MMIKSMMNIVGCISFLHTLFMGGCSGTIVDPPPVQQEKKWEEIALFKNADIRYMTKHNNMLYVSAVFHSGAKDSSVVFTTKDAETWDTLKSFIDDIGPLAFNGDTLTVLETGRIWDYHPSFGWKIKYKILVGAWITFDMFYLNNELIVFELRNKAYYQNQIREIIGTSRVSRFVKSVKNGKEIAYTIPYYVYLGNPVLFDGFDFIPLANGISSDENQTPNYPALCIKNDTLYAGFNSPTRIKKYVNGYWVNVTDSINNTQDANLFIPQLTNTASSIVFQNERMFVGTECTGVLEWCNNKWVSISNGLPKFIPSMPNIDAYTSIIFLEEIDGKLITGFGEPGFAPLHNGRGLYTFRLK